jgi:hypothetical protein
MQRYIVPLPVYCLLCWNGNCIENKLPPSHPLHFYLYKISSVAFAKGDPKNLIPEWSGDINHTPVQGWFTNAVAQAKEDKGDHLNTLGTLACC